MRAMAALCERTAEITDLSYVAGLLMWDQQTMMPAGGASARADQMATVSGLIHKKLTSKGLATALERAEAQVGAMDEASFERGLCRNMRRLVDRATRLSDAFVRRLSQAQSRAYTDWLAARQAGRYELFQEAFAVLCDLEREKAELYGHGAEPYDALLAESEPGLTTRALQDLFAALKERLVPLTGQVAEAPAAPDLFTGVFSEKRQWALCMEAARCLNFDFGRGRMDLSVHPFTTSFSPRDVRITTRLQRSFLGNALFSTLHEVGHGLYAQGIPDEQARTPMAEGASSGMHESQSRLWENIVGRSRPFWRFFLPKLAEHFPGQFAGADVEAIYRSVNRAGPSLIRTEADELTYNLHILVRWELERALASGALRAADLKDAFAAKMEAYLGVTPKDDVRGVLQDIHWTEGLGSFPSYTLGNIISVQLYAAALRAAPDLEDKMASGDISGLLAFMRTNVHRYGGILTPEEIVVRATGEPITPGPYLEYIEGKYRALYA